MRPNQQPISITDEQRARVNELAEYWFPNGIRRGRSATITMTAPGVRLKMAEIKTLYDEVFGGGKQAACGQCTNDVYQTSGLLIKLWRVAN